MMKILKRIKHYFYRSNENEIDMQEAKEMMKLNNKMLVIDVRSPQEYQEGHLDRAISIPLYELGSKINNVAPYSDTLILVYCQHGTRSKKAVQILERLGYNNVYSLKNGIDGY